MGTQMIKEDATLYFSSPNENMVGSDKFENSIIGMMIIEGDTELKKIRINFKGVK